jgi:hypothetical protein
MPRNRRNGSTILQGIPIMVQTALAVIEDQAAALLRCRIT